MVHRPVRFRAGMTFKANNSSILSQVFPTPLFGPGPLTGLGGTPISPSYETMSVQLHHANVILNLPRTATLDYRSIGLDQASTEWMSNLNADPVKAPTSTDMARLLLIMDYSRRQDTPCLAQPQFPFVHVELTTAFST